MNFNFEPVLVIFTVLTGTFSLIDIVFLSPKRREHFFKVSQEKEESLNKFKRFFVAVCSFLFGLKDPLLKKQQKSKDINQAMQKQHEKILLPSVFFEYARSFFPVFFFVLLLRTFLFEPFLVPTGSLEPTVLPGDFLLVSKYAYGLKPPLMRYTLLKTGEPKHGDIVVFRWPPNPKINYVKRVVGIPGDHISYIDKVLYVNGEKAAQVFIKQGADGKIKKEENLLGVKHNILLDPSKPGKDFQDLIVPKNHYFMMGDNRDYSLDSRYWGFVPEYDLLGEGLFIWLSKNPGHFSFRWNRVGTKL